MAGVVQPADMVSEDGHQKWQQASEIDGLFPPLPGAAVEGFYADLDAATDNEPFALAEELPSSSATASVVAEAEDIAIPVLDDGDAVPGELPLAVVGEEAEPNAPVKKAKCKKAAAKKRADDQLAAEEVDDEPHESPKSHRWYLAKNKKRLGPFASKQLRQMAKAGMVEPDDLVLEDGDKEWQPASTLFGLFPSLSHAATQPHRGIFVLIFGILGMLGCGILFAAIVFAAIAGYVGYFDKSNSNAKVEAAKARAEGEVARTARAKAEAELAKVKAEAKKPVEKERFSNMVEGPLKKYEELAAKMEQLSYQIRAMKQKHAESRMLHEQEADLAANAGNHAHLDQIQAQKIKEAHDESRLSREIQETLYEVDSVSQWVLDWMKFEFDQAKRLPPDEEMKALDRYEGWLARKKRAAERIHTANLSSGL